jgi:hypothetical protein
MPATASKNQSPRDDDLEPDLEETERFLEAIDPNADEYCYQTFDDTPRKNAELAQCRTGTFATCRRWLIRANATARGGFRDHKSNRWSRPDEEKCH